MKTDKDMGATVHPQSSAQGYQTPQPNNERSSDKQRKQYTPVFEANTEVEPKKVGVLDLFNYATTLDKWYIG